MFIFKVLKASDKLSEKQKDPELSVKGIVDRLSEAGLQTKLYYSVQVCKLFIIHY